MISKESKEYARFKQDLARDGFDIDDCDNVIEVLKTKGNGNGLVGLKYNADTKTYNQAPKISKTKADKIYHSVARQQWIEMSEVDDEAELPF